MAASYPPDQEVIANAEAALVELRNHIDHQSKDAESIDTKASTLLTVTAAAAALVVTRIGPLDSDLRRLAAGAAAVVVVALAVSLFQALRPRAEFAYGPNPPTMGAYADRQSRKAFALWMVDSAIVARATNVEFLKAKQGWYQRALRTVVATVVAIAGWFNRERLSDGASAAAATPACRSVVRKKVRAAAAATTHTSPNAALSDRASTTRVLVSVRPLGKLLPNGHRVSFERQASLPADCLDGGTSSSCGELLDQLD